MGVDDKQRKNERLWTPANIVTLVRICLVPVFVVAMLTPWPAYFGLEVSSAVKSWVAAFIFILLAATDGIDGYLARSRGEVTDFGKFMDPLADKILVVAALLSLIELHVLPSWPALIILIREFIVSGIRMIAASKGTVIAASWYGKAKTVFQIIAIVLFIVKDTVVEIDPLSALHNPLYLLSWAVMVVALVLTIISMLDYLVKARHLLGFAPKRDNAEAVSPDVLEGNGSAPQDDAELAASSSVVSQYELRRLASDLVVLAKEKGVTVGCAESLTGGCIAAQITSVPGSSEVLKGGVVSYVNDVKHDLLGVSATDLESVGAVSEQVARQMADGAAAALECEVAVSVTGIAGPGGAEPEKPVGTVWMGLHVLGTSTETVRFLFSGDREAVRTQTVQAALQALLRAVKELH